MYPIICKKNDAYKGHFFWRQFATDMPSLLTNFKHIWLWDDISLAENLMRSKIRDITCRKVVDKDRGGQIGWHKGGHYGDIWHVTQNMSFTTFSVELD